MKRTLENTVFSPRQQCSVFVSLGCWRWEACNKRAQPENGAGKPGSWLLLLELDYVRLSYAEDKCGNLKQGRGLLFPFQEWFISQTIFFFFFAWKGYTCKIKSGSTLMENVNKSAWNGQISRPSSPNTYIKVSFKNTEIGEICTTRFSVFVYWE